MIAPLDDVWPEDFISAGTLTLLPFEVFVRGAVGEASGVETTLLGDDFFDDFSGDFGTPLREEIDGEDVGSSDGVNGGGEGGGVSLSSSFKPDDEGRGNNDDCEFNACNRSNTLLWKKSISGTSSPRSPKTYSPALSGLLLSGEAGTDLGDDGGDGIDW